MAAPTVTLSNGAKMPVVGLGTYDATDESEIELSLNTALKNGYRHIDTAWAYHNEEVLGRVLKQWFDAGKLTRKDVFITTKLPMHGISVDKIEELLRDSLTNLGMDYVDLYLIHFPIGIDVSNVSAEGAVFQKNQAPNLIPKTDHAGIWRKMEEQVKAGRAKAIGISNYNLDQVKEILKTAVIKPASLQVENHLYLPQNELVDFCNKNQIVVVAYCPLANPGRAKLLVRMGLEQTKPLPDILTDKVLAEVAKKHNKSVAQIALRFLLERNVVVIPKSVSEKRVIENISLFDFKLDGEDMAALKKLDNGEQGRICDWKLISPEVHLHPDYPFP